MVFFSCLLYTSEWNDLVYTGNLEQAYNRLKKTNNFPEFTSRVCPALCEAACTCGHYGDPVSVKGNEYGIIENAYEKGYADPKPPRVRTGKQVAVIGSGPAGLAAADQLNKRGHKAVSYTHLDVYKRQRQRSPASVSPMALEQQKN